MHIVDTQESTTMDKYKRLARVKRSDDKQQNSINIEEHSRPSNIDLMVIPYSEKSFVVQGDLMNHGSALTELGGKYNIYLKCGAGYIFNIHRKESVENYIDTGDIKPFVYNDEMKKKYMQTENEKHAINTQLKSVVYQDSETQETMSNIQVKQLRKPKERVWTILELRGILKEIRDAFEVDSYYQGDSIIDVLEQIEEKYLPKPKVIKAAPKQ